jgi:hypothetical protein
MKQMTDSGGSSMLRHALALFLLLLLASIPALAQSTQGVIAGIVQDSTGAVVVSAKITAVNLATGGTSTAESTSGGTFRFPGLLVGKYDVTVNAPGFQTVKQTGVDVLVSNTTALNFTLTVGSVSESVEVSAQSTSVQSESSDVGTVIDTRQVVELPLALGGVGAMRSPEAFMFLEQRTAITASSFRRWAAVRTSATRFFSTGPALCAQRTDHRLTKPDLP